MSDSWNRLEEVVTSTGLSINGFATSIGLKRSENLYRIKKGKNSISKELVDKITTIYCNISKSWLLTGEGSMYQKEEKSASGVINPTKKIPLYDSVVFDFETQIVNGLPDPLCYIDVPTLNNCDFAATFVGDSMKPEITSGSIVTLKGIDIDLILPGEMYLIVTDKYTTIRFIRTVDGDSKMYRLVPANKVDYDEIFIAKNVILRVFLVKGVISTKFL